MQTIPQAVLDAAKRINDAADAAEAFCREVGQLIESGDLPALTPLEAQLVGAAVFGAAVEEDTPGANPVEALHKCIVAVSAVDQINAQTVQQEAE